MYFVVIIDTKATSTLKSLFCLAGIHNSWKTRGSTHFFGGGVYGRAQRIMLGFDGWKKRRSFWKCYFLSSGLAWVWKLKSNAVLTFVETSFPWWLWKAIKSKRWIFVCHACFQQGNAVIINQYPHQAESAKGWKTLSKVINEHPLNKRWSFILEKVNAIISNKKHPCGWETASICSHQNKVINNNCNLSRSLKKFPSLPPKKA